MTYIGSTPITQYFQEGRDVFPASATSTATFVLSRPVATVATIQVFVGNNELIPDGVTYTVAGNTLTLPSAITNTQVIVRYLTGSSFSLTPPVGSLSINSLATTGTPSANNFLRGDGAWGLPNIPQNNKGTTPYTLQKADQGYHISTSSGVTVPSGVFAIGDVVFVLNNSTSAITITQGSGVTMYYGGSATTGNRTLAQYGLATILCFASNTFSITGQGLT